MRLIIFSDLHGKTEMIHKLSEEIYTSDLVLICGDITHFGREKETKKIIDIVSEYNRNILAVPGNCDYREVNQYLVKNNMSLDCRNRIIEDVFFTGVGGSLPCPGSTPVEYLEEEFEIFLNEIIKEKPQDIPIVLLMHQPPYKTKVDMLSNREHVGSKSVRNFIEKYQPDLCFCGHIHESMAKDVLGTTVLINPGPLGMASYAKAEITKENVQAEIFNFFTNK